MGIGADESAMFEVSLNLIPSKQLTQTTKKAVSKVCDVFPIPQVIFLFEEF